MEREEKLIEMAPHLYAEKCWLDCGPGWDPLIQDLSRKLEKIIVEGIESGAWDDDDHPVVVQIKEKFGGLRFYLSCETDEMSNLVEQAEAESTQICENCGCQGKMRECNRWYSVNCDVCWQKIERRNLDV